MNISVSQSFIFILYEALQYGSVLCHSVMPEMLGLFKESTYKYYPYSKEVLTCLLNECVILFDSHTQTWQVTQLSLCFLLMMMMMIT